MTVELPQTLAANPLLSTWLTVHSDGFIDLRFGKVELGQGIVTALTQIAINELGVKPGMVRPSATNTHHSPDEGITAGSMSVAISGASVRRACAEVRHLFLRAAAQRVDLSPAGLRVVAGNFFDPSGNRIATYGDLAADVDLDVAAGDPTLAVEFLGSAQMPDLPRVDLPDKIFGRPRFVHDLSFDGMLHGRVVRPPRPGAHLLEAPVDRALAMPGVRHVVLEGDFLAVIAAREGEAVGAAELLAATSSWTPSATLPDHADLSAWLREQPVETTKVRADGADHRGGEGTTTMKATYAKPFVAHGSIAPSCAIANFDGKRLDIWTHSQGVFTLSAAITVALDLDKGDVVVQHVEGAGSYGHNSADDVAFDAALLAVRMPGQPIRVQWSRADELSWEPFGPAMVSDVEATLGPDGIVTDWSYELWSNGHTARPGYTPTRGLLGDSHRAGADELPPSIDPPAARGLGSARNAEPYYDFTRIDVTAHRLLTMPIRVSALRSLGAHLNIFALESFMDELAHATDRDPLEFRLAQLSDPRARNVLTTAADAAGWGKPLADNAGRGIAFARYKNRGSYCAVIADVEAKERVRVTRLTIAVDVGRVISEDGVRNQIEGGAIQATSWALRERVAFDREAITSTDWDSYPILRFSEVPHVDVHLISQPDEPSLGAGEATQGPIPAAIGNAVFGAIGVRVRDLPFTVDSVAAAIDAQF